MLFYASSVSAEISITNIPLILDVQFKLKVGKFKTLTGLQILLCFIIQAIKRRRVALVQLQVIGDVCCSEFLVCTNR